MAMAMAMEMEMEMEAEAAAEAAQEGRFLAPRPDDLDRRAPLHLSFFFMCIAALGFVHFTAAAAAAAEDVLALFAFWIVCLLIFLVSLALDALPEEAARIVASVARALYECFFLNRI